MNNAKKILNYLQQMINELNEEDYNISLQVIPILTATRYANGKKRKFVKYTRIIEIEDKQGREVEENGRK